MSNTFRDVNYPATYKYSSDSDSIPLEFYEDTFPISKSIDLLLGYFSSNAIKILSKSFAEFIFNGGEMRIITNHVFSLKDKENLLDHSIINNENKVIDIFSDIEKLEMELSDYGKHFFDCLRYLQKKGRLKIQPVKFNNVDLAHSKKMILYDGHDYISTDGSINFTLSALIKNSESFEVNAPWKGEIFKKRTVQERENFNKIFNQEHPSYEYVNKEDIEVVINTVGRDKDIKDLMDDSVNLKTTGYSDKVKRILEKKKERFNKKLQFISNTPRFPYPQGPREYQKDAYNAWVENDYKGVFAMATGTGKTLASLNCLLNEYLKSNRYNAIILVPTNILLTQWVSEASKFNFKNVYSSAERGWDKKLNSDLFLLNNGLGKNFIFITTYATFNGKKFQGLIKFKKLYGLTLIADEVHNLGSKKSIKNLAENIERRIGLSATPNRKYDEKGTREIEKYFNSSGPCYTFSFSMLDAIDQDFLTKYRYYPYLTYLNDDEIKQYKKISKQLMKHFNFSTFKYRESAELLLIQRKRIIHQAKNKKKVFREIISELTKKGKLSHTLVYVPEGFQRDYSEKENFEVSIEDERIINEYSKILHECNVSTYQMLGETSNREVILKRFENGKIDTLTAMKTLDEGVDIPATRNAIFCASTGNPRQFVQRRGRILRKFKGKEIANIYDIIIGFNPDIWIDESPDERTKILKMELNIFKSEIYRVANFLYASDNRSDISLGRDKNLKEIVQLAERHGISLDLIINDLIKTDKGCN